MSSATSPPGENLSDEAAASTSTLLARAVELQPATSPSSSTDNCEVDGGAATEEPQEGHCDAGVDHVSQQHHQLLLHGSDDNVEEPVSDIPTNGGIAHAKPSPNKWTILAYVACVVS